MSFDEGTPYRYEVNLAPASSSAMTPTGQKDKALNGDVQSHGPQMLFPGESGGCLHNSKSAYFP